MVNSTYIDSLQSDILEALIVKPDSICEQAD